MLTITIDLLTGRYAATRYNDRTRAEWPPHPARLFSAAVAAWADADVPDDDERAALEWWESLGPPAIGCSWRDEAGTADQWSERTNVVHFVPVNDTQVVGRDTSQTYLRLREARNTLETTNPADAKGRVRATKAVDKLELKAAEDSARVASAGDAPAGSIAILPAERGRQARVYPTIVPGDPFVTFQWPIDPDPAKVEVLDGLLGRIPRLGHSSSLVSVSAASVEGRVPALEPSGSGDTLIRVARPGQLAALEAAFAAHQGVEPRILPGRDETYGTPTTRRSASGSSFDDRWVTLSADRRFGPRDVLGLSRAIRSSLMHHSPLQPAPEVLSGHQPGAGTTAPTRKPHLAIVPIPFVGHERATGNISTVALILPRHADPDEGTAVRAALRAWSEADGQGEGARLFLAGGIHTTLLETGPDGPSHSRPATWCRPSRTWASVVPVALDRHAGDLSPSDPAKRAGVDERVRSTVSAACENIGLPAPVAVEWSLDSFVRATRPSRAYPPYRVRSGSVTRQLLHVRVEFEAPVTGPVILGAGRFYGYGLMLPLPGGTGGSDA